jgi:hypothetical protein
VTDDAKDLRLDPRRLEPAIDGRMFRGQPLQADQQIGPAIKAEFDDTDVT